MKKKARYAPAARRSLLETIRGNVKPAVKRRRRGRDPPGLPRPGGFAGSDPRAGGAARPRRFRLVTASGRTTVVLRESGIELLRPLVRFLPRRVVFRGAGGRRGVSLRAAAAVFRAAARSFLVAESLDARGPTPAPS